MLLFVSGKQYIPYVSDSDLNGRLNSLGSCWQYFLAIPSYQSGHWKGDILSF